MIDAIQFYGDKLRLARLIAGMSQKDLGDLASVTRQFIHQIESGTKIPSEELRNVFCEVLHVLPIFFEVPLGNDVKSEQCHFRKRRTTPVGVANRVLAYGTIFEQLVVFLNEHLSLPDNNFPDLPLSDITKRRNNEIEDAAEHCRKHWGLGITTPIDSMVRVLENAGAVITCFESVSEKVDALSINRLHPIVVRNKAKASICRLRFDLAHECGHLVLHQGIETGEPNSESEADRFASSFLLPRSAFVTEFPRTVGSRLNWKEIYNLKKRWKVSVRAIIYRAHDLGLITAQQYRSANVWLNKSGQTKVERCDEDIPVESPELLQNAINVLGEQLSIKFSDIAFSLGTKTEILSLLTGIPAPEEIIQSNVSNIALHR